MNSPLTLIPASTFWQRLAGLHSLAGLSANMGLWIAPCAAVHTLGLAYSIDLLYLDSKQQVLRRVDAMRPNRWSLCLSAYSVVELPAGYCILHPDYAAKLQQAFQQLHSS